MKQNNNNAAESGFLGSISSSSIRNLLPKSLSSNRNKSNSSSSNLKLPKKSNAENTPPADPNIVPINNHHHQQSQPKTPISHTESNAPHDDPPVKASPKSCSSFWVILNFEAVICNLFNEFCEKNLSFIIF